MSKRNTIAIVLSPSIKFWIVITLFRNWIPFLIILISRFQSLYRQILLHYVIVQLKKVPSKRSLFIAIVGTKRLGVLYIDVLVSKLRLNALLLVMMIRIRTIHQTVRIFHQWLRELSEVIGYEIRKIVRLNGSDVSLQGDEYLPKTMTWWIVAKKIARKVAKEIAKEIAKKERSRYSVISFSMYIPNIHGSPCIVDEYLPIRQV